MNLQNVLWLLLGMCIGAEIMGLVMKYRYDKVAKEVRSMNERISETMSMNNRIIGKWAESVELNNELLTELIKRD